MSNTCGHVPEARPQDAHDVSATYRLAVDPIDRTRTPNSGAELVDLLADRHAVLMATRPDKRPGQLKDVPNFAGGCQFVEPALVEGTLVKGYQVLDPVRYPLARAAAMMALVTECHPFDDGNGRIARLAANAELSAAGEVRLVIPNVYRNNYLAALSGFSFALVTASSSSPFSSSLSVGQGPSIGRHSRALTRFSSAATHSRTRTAPRT